MAVSAITLIQKLQKLFGARAVSDMMGRTTNVQTLAQGVNNPFARQFSKKYLAKNPNGVEEAAQSILENMQFAFGNKNIQQMKNFEANVDTLYNLKFPPKPGEAKVVDIGTKKQVTGKGLESLKDDLGLPEDIPPTSPLGESVTRAKRDDLLSTLQAKSYSANIEAFRRPIVRQILLRDKRINLPEEVRKSLENKTDLTKGADPKMDPLRLLNEYYDVDFKKLDFLEEIRITAGNEFEAADRFLKKGGLEPKKIDLSKYTDDDLNNLVKEEMALSAEADKLSEAGMNYGRVKEINARRAEIRKIIEAAQAVPESGYGTFKADLSLQKQKKTKTKTVEDIADAKLIENMYRTAGPRTLDEDKMYLAEFIAEDAGKVLDDLPASEQKVFIDRAEKALIKNVEDFADKGNFDPDGMAQGGRAGYVKGGLSKLINFLQGKFGKKAITTADQLDRPGFVKLKEERLKEFEDFKNRNPDFQLPYADRDKRVIPEGMDQELVDLAILQGNFARKYEGRINPKLMEQILNDTDAQRVKEVISEIEQAFIMQEKGMGNEEIINILLEGANRKKQAFGGIVGQLHMNEGGRVGLKKGGPPNPGRRNFMKLLAGLASIPVLGKFFKGAKVASKVVPLQNTATEMPTWFPKFVDKFINNSVGKKIDADLMEFKNSDLPNVKVTKHDDGRVYIEGSNEYNEGYQIEYKPPGYEVVDEKTGKAVKTQGEFEAVEGRHVALSPEDYDTDAFYVDDLDELTTIDVAEMEKYSTGKITKTVKDAFKQDTGLKKGMHSYDMAVGKAENQADILKDADLLDEDFASGGRVGMLAGGGLLKAMLRNLAKEKRMSGSEMLAVMNYKALPSKIKNLMTKEQFEQLKSARLKQVKNFRDMMQTRLDFNKSIQQGKAIDDKGTGMSKIFDLLEEDFGKKSAVPKNITEKDILEMEQMIKNMEMKGRKPNAAGGLAGQLKL